MSGHMLKSLVMSLNTWVIKAHSPNPTSCLAQCGTNMHKNVQEKFAISFTTLEFARNTVDDEHDESRHDTISSVTVIKVHTATS